KIGHFSESPPQKVDSRLFHAPKNKNGFRARKKTFLRQNFHNSLIINTSYFDSNHAFYVKNRTLFTKNTFN
ncbi:MAG: hypothetical protein NC206_11480, partial [Bacteroides sp.]|nr:hypothetical protein [Bacteroides sp.]